MESRTQYGIKTMHTRVWKTLEEYLLSTYLGNAQMKQVTNIYLDKELGFISYSLRGDHKTLSIDLWGKPSEVYLTLLYSDLIAQGYLAVPIEDGWVVLGGTETYYLDRDAQSCTCPENSYRGSCKHIMMAKGQMLYNSRISLARREMLTEV